MIYVKVSSKMFSEQDMQMKDMNIEVEGMNSYAYLNLNNLDITPRLDDEGIPTGQTLLLTTTGRTCAVIDDTPENFLSKISAVVIVPDSEIKEDDIRLN